MIPLWVSFEEEMIVDSKCDTPKKIPYHRYLKPLKRFNFVLFF